MATLLAPAIFVITVALSLIRPRFGRFRVQPWSAAVFGTSLVVMTGILPVSEMATALSFIALPILTIASLMVITIIADRRGFFRYLAWKIAKSAGGSGRRLFTYLFFSGTVVGTFFTNDAAVLIFTPLVYQLVEEIDDGSWTIENKIPYYFAVLYVANLVGGFVISNPINIMVSSWFNIGFLTYASWMMLPAIVSMVATYASLLFIFRRAIPERFPVPACSPVLVARPQFVIMSSVVLGLTLLGFFTEQMTGIHTSYVAFTGAVVLLILNTIYSDDSPILIGRAVGWNAIIFVVGIFLVTNGLRETGLTGALGTIILRAVSQNVSLGAFVTGIVAAGGSALMNNHPTAWIMALTLQDLPLGELLTRTMAFAALIGGDLGPKMLPIGSLAALMWFQILRERGVEISYWQYIKIGVPVTLIALLLSLLMLILEYALRA